MYRPHRNFPAVAIVAISQTNMHSLRQVLAGDDIGSIWKTLEQMGLHIANQPYIEGDDQCGLDKDNTGVKHKDEHISIAEFVILKNYTFARVLDGLTTLKIVDESSEYPNSNYSIDDACNKAGRGSLDKITIWGGSIGNCAGDSFSTLVFQQRISLRSLIFHPVHSKRLLIQPHYKDRRRMSTNTPVIFPRLTELSVKEYAARRPLNWGYELPALRELNVLIVARPMEGQTISGPETVTPPIPVGWSDIESPEAYAHVLLKDCPNLRTISLIATSDWTDVEARHTLCTLVTPTRVSWERYRLVLLGARQRTSLIGKISTGGGDTDGLVNLVLSFLHEPEWRVSFGQSACPDGVSTEKKCSPLIAAGC